MEKAKIYEQELFDENGKKVGKLAILVGGTQSDNPVNFMSEVISNYVGREKFVHFIERRLDNPWTHVIFEGLNNLPLRPIREDDNIKK